MNIAAKGDQSTAGDLRYQLSFGQTARECSVQGETLNIKVGVQGRVILGPLGAPGPVDVPLRYAVVDITGKSAPFDFLGLDHLLDEKLVCTFTCHQLTMQPCLMHSAGDQPPVVELDRRDKRILVRDAVHASTEVS